MGFVYFLIMIGVLVFVHELGHFLAAKAFGIKVIRFSLGFGPRLVGYERGETEYVICALPLGGYVRMLESQADEEARDRRADAGRALDEKPIWQRVIVMFASPAFNILLPISLFFAYGLTRTEAPPSIAGDIIAGMPADEAGMEAGDRITSIDGEPVSYWFEITDAVSDAPAIPLTFTWERRGRPMSATIVPTSMTESADAHGIVQTTRGQIGILTSAHDATIAVEPGSPAYAAGLRSFDRIARVGPRAVRRFDEIDAALAAAPAGRPIEIVAMRPRDLSEVSFAEAWIDEPVRVEIDGGQGGAPAYGIGRAGLVLRSVEPKSAAARAGLRAGDRITALDGEPQSSWYVLERTINQQITAALVARPAGSEEVVTETFRVTYKRGAETLKTDLTPDVVKYADEYKQDRFRREIGWTTRYGVVEPDPIALPLAGRIGYAARLGVSRTWEGLSMIGRLFQRIAEGKLSFSEQVGGPILVGELAARAGQAGIATFLWTMSILSINLAVFNLLPIPLLDGGRIALLLIEAVKRGPLSLRTRQLTSYIGFAAIVVLMLLAFKNDIERNWDRIVDLLL